jgi:hypothetical protein
MNEEISVTLTNNTNEVQSVTLFTEPFAIPNNINSYGFWDISQESFFYTLPSTPPPVIIPNVKIKISTLPITNATPFTIVALPTTNVEGVVLALNSINQGVFSNNNNVISVASQNNLFYGDLRLSPDFVFNVTSNVPNGLIPAISLSIGIVPNVFDIPSGITTNQTYDNIILSGQTVTVGYSAGGGAIFWGITITQYNANGLATILFTNNGIGVGGGSYSFTYPQNGNIGVTLSIV